MKRLTKNRWEAYQPATNAAWLHYLADICLTHKLPQLPNADKMALRGFRKRVLGYACAADAIWDEYFLGCWSSDAKHNHAS